MIPILIALISVGAARAERPHPSFDCAAAKTPIEKAICASIPLSQSDRVLADLYKARLKLANEDQRKSLRQEQQAWVKSRNHECAGGNSACLEKAYLSRIQALTAEVQAAPASQPSAQAAPVGGPPQGFAVDTLLGLRTRLKLDAAFDEVLTATEPVSKNYTHYQLKGTQSRWSCSKPEGFVCEQCTGGPGLLPGASWPDAVKLLFYRSADKGCRLGAYEISPNLTESTTEGRSLVGVVPSLDALKKALSAPAQTIARKFCQGMDDNEVVKGQDHVFKAGPDTLVVREDKDDWSFEATGVSLVNIDPDDMARLLVASPRFFKDSRYWGSRYDSCP